MGAFSKNVSPHRSIALTFSGGGFRAAGFSLGTMVLLQKLGLLEKVEAISSASRGSIAAAFFLMAKAKPYTLEKPCLSDCFSFFQEFYIPLKSFLESDKVANAILSDLGGTQKMIKNAANCYREQLLETLGGISKHSPAKTISELVWQLLQDTNTSPDCLSINSTNMTDASLFRFAMLRTIITDKKEGQEIHREGKGIVIGDKFVDISNQKNEQITKDFDNLSLGDVIAASSCFPLGFEPIIFPEDFCDNEESLKRLQKLTPNQAKVALMDAGLYDNLALTSILTLVESSGTIMS
jgi:predicted acylesterase/phospholipase RssA